MRWRGAPAVGTAGVREPAVAGRFYEGRADRLAAQVDRYVADARAALDAARRPGPGDSAQQVAIVVPHAGHVYSGPTAGYAYAVLDPARVQHVVLLGPAHYVPVDGIGLSTAGAWRTPLGEVPLDRALAADLRQRFDSVEPADGAHAPEHSLEVQVPFLQRVLDEGWTLLPLLVGSDLPDEVAAVITRCAQQPGTLVVVSTDLSHYLDHEAAVARDDRTIRAILARRVDGIGRLDACGRHPLRGLLLAAEANDWSVQLLDARNSGDTAGDWDRVVGYAAFLVVGHSGASSEAARPAGTQQQPGPADPVVPDEDVDLRETAQIPGDARAALLAVARSTIEEALATGRRPQVDPLAWDTVLRRPGAAFVTLRAAGGELLGCIGSLSPRQALVADVAEHAFDAAFRDPRFPPLTPARAHGMVIDISVLSPSRSFPATSYDDLLARLPRGSGVVVQAGRHRATFLPAVWQQLPQPRAFLSALWRKAGLAPGQWPAGTRIEVYDTEEFAEPVGGAAATSPAGG